MAKSKEYELAIKIAGEVEKSFFNSTKLSKNELQELARTATITSSSVQNSFSSGMKNVSGGFDAISSGAKKAFDITAKTAVTAATAIAGITTASIVTGSNFESAFAGVKKTVNATNAEFDQLEDNIREMAKNKPMDADEIAGIAEAAGQLGIANKYIDDFTDTMADLGVATNLTSEEGATEFARFANITGMSQDKFDELGSTVVALGNNMATTESEITEMAMRLAGAGSQVDMSEAQIMGFAAALSSVGIEAEAGGSAFSKVMVDMQLAVESGKNGLKDYAKVAGMSTNEFQKAFKKDAAGAMIEFVKGLSNVKRNGKSAISVLDGMGITEVRMRDALLRASNAGDLFSNSLDISGSAWKDNTALTKEAEQRYATFDSKLRIFKNGLKDFGISIYQDMREPLAEGVGTATDFVNTIAGKVDKENIISNLIKSFTTKLPTAIRHVKEFTSSFLEFADPVLKVGGWLLQHPDIIVSTLVGIGTTLATYKIANGIFSLASAIIKLTPAGGIILGVAGAVAAVSGIVTLISKANKEMKKQNLAEHFGDISLSLEDLQEVAGYIVQTDNLGKIREAIGAMDDMESISDSIRESVKALNKMNWKIGIGIELTKDEKQEYQDDIKSYIADVQELVTQKQYAVTLAVSILMGADGLEESNVITKINNFYADKQKELADIGNKLNKAITDAFQDGLLDVDEVKEITELQSQMAKIQSAVAGSQFDAQLELLNLKYSSADLDPETFQNLQAEINKQVQAAVSDYDEALTLSISNANVMLKDGSISKDQYDTMVKQLEDGYNEQVSDIQLKAVNFQLDAIMQQYDDELSKAMPQYKEKLEKYITEYFSGDSLKDWEQAPGIMLYSLFEGNDVPFKSSELDKSSRLALTDLYDQMKPSVEQMEKIKERYESMGMEVPKSISDGLTNATLIGALVRDSDSVKKLISDSIVGDQNYINLVNDAKEIGASIPSVLSESINDNFNRIFGKGISATIPIKIKTNTIYDSNGNLTAPYSNSFIQSQLGGHADGGIFDKPHIAWFAEEGPEAAIPLDGSKNAFDLWRTTGQLLGVEGFGKGYDETSSDSFTQLYDNMSGQNQTDKSLNSENLNGYGQITYNPVLNFYGEAPDKEELDSALGDSQDKFDQMMRQWMKDNDRFSFA